MAVALCTALGGAAADPRLQDSCRDYFGAPPFARDHALDGIVVEDLGISVRGSPSHPRLNRTRGIPLAKPMRLAMAGRAPPAAGAPYFVEVPKSATSSVKAELRLRGVTHNEPLYAASMPVESSHEAFAFSLVREPLARAISAFGTIVTRTSACVRHPRAFRRWARGGRLRDVCPPHLYESSLLNKFTAFAEMLHAGNLTRAGQTVLIYQHAWSQMYYLQLYPFPLHYVGRLPASWAGAGQEVQRAMASFDARSGLPTGAGAMRDVAVSANVHEGKFGGVSSSWLRANAPKAALAKIVHYFRQDYACLGYPVPEDLAADVAALTTSEPLPLARY